MTQEELDALMSGDVDMDDIEEEDKEVVEEELEDNSDDVMGHAGNKEGYPPMPTDDKMVDQLDEVTKESEQKASEIFDIIDTISNDLMDAEGTAQETKDIMESNIELFNILIEKFPHVERFKEQLEKNKKSYEEIDSVIEKLQDSGDSIMNAMDIMQYQDIHRQKIERVINIIRTLSGYLNNMFSSTKSDDSRVSSAVHLPGDETEDVLDADGIEALLASFDK
ncbi:MAG: chemotaxis protein [Campylobacterota bacterium]|nr:chemotaxis protein [Campylobacterota bacterium]